MSALGSFFSWAQLEDYIVNTLGITYTENPTGWVDACKELTANSKYVKVINDATGEVTSQYVNSDLLNGVGEFHIGSNYSGPETVTGGSGVKSAPTVKSVITDGSTQTAVITDQAVGVKDVGLLQKTKISNIIGGLAMVYGLTTTAINVSNSKVWKDLCNSVFDTEFTEATPIEVLKNFLDNKMSVFTSVDNDDLVTHIPDSIADKMYNFLAAHMEDTGEHIIEPGFDGLSIVYRWIDRHFDTSDPTIYSFDRYISTSNPTDTYTVPVASPPTDAMMELFASDYITMLMASGYTVPSNVGDALVASMPNVRQMVSDAFSEDIYNSALLNIRFLPLSGRSSVPKTVPIALSDINYEVYCYWNAPVPTDPDDKYQLCDFDVYNSELSSYLAPGESFTGGDCIKYKKRNKTGADDNDYGYLLKIANGASCNLSGFWFTYPSNEMQMSNYWSQSATVTHTPSNGYSYEDYRKTLPNDFIRVWYSNVGVDGQGINYGPDDYLVAAGFKKNNGDKNPDPNKTKEQRYPAQNNKKEAANPQVDTGTGTVTNNITTYTPSVVPFGDSTAQRIIDHGINNTSDPDSYIDDRSQSEKTRGEVNTNDPIDGYNEDTQNAIDDYNESRNDPEHYPNPIPENQPNPTYPVNPPSDTSGDSGDTPTPSLMDGVEASGMASIYNPTKAEIVSFSGWLWSHNFLDNFLKIFANPMDAIIGLHILYATPHTTSPSNIIVGYLDSGVAADVVDQQFTEIDCGTVTVPEYYGNAIDYEPYTQVHCYLPFIGIVSLKPNDVLGKQLNIKYGVDVLTGTCLAILTTKKGDSEIACYNFSGNCAVQVPLSGGNYAQMITGLAGFLVGSVGAVATANPIMALGAGASLLNTHLDVSHSGNIGANAGAMGVRKPYLIITRKSAYEAGDYNRYYGYPANKTVTLGRYKGFTRVKSIHIETMTRATDNEKAEIETLLKEGVIIK